MKHWPTTPKLPKSSNSSLFDNRRWTVQRTPLIARLSQPYAPVSRRTASGQGFTTHWQWGSPQESPQPITPQELELLSSSSFGRSGDMTAFRRSAICIFPLLFMRAFYLCTLSEHQKSAEAHASTTMLFCSDPHHQATFTKVDGDGGQDLLGYRAQTAPEWSTPGLPAVEKVHSKSCRHWDGSLPCNMTQVYVLMKQC